MHIYLTVHLFACAFNINIRNEIRNFIATDQLTKPVIVRMFRKLLLYSLNAVFCCIRDRKKDDFYQRSHQRWTAISWRWVYHLSNLQ
jgi:hypothetical protein